LLAETGITARETILNIGVTAHQAHPQYESDLTEDDRSPEADRRGAGLPGTRPRVRADSPPNEGLDVGCARLCC
jgi:hypothetical protein